MRSFRYPLLAAALVLLTARPALCQTSTAPIRDPQAVALVQKAIAAMGTVPSDSTATGAIQVVEGSSSQAGTIEILTRGMNATSETISLPSGQRTVVYSNGSAKETVGSQSVIASFEAVLTDQASDFPLPLLSSLVANPDVAIHYVATETLNGTSAHHIQMWNSFASRPHLQSLAAFSERDIWLDSTSGLPLKIAYSRRTAGGTAPAIPMVVEFSNYRNAGGILFPFQIEKSCNGTLWQTIDIQNVSFNTGLTDAQFQVQ